MKSKILQLLLCAFFVVFWTHEAHAAAPVTMWVQADVSSFYGPNPRFWETKDLACSAGSADIAGKTYSAPWQFMGSGTFVAPDTCKLDVKNTSNQQVSFLTKTGWGNALRCKSPGGGAGTMPDTTKPLDQQCPDPNPCQKDQPAGDVDITTGWRTGPDVNSAVAREYPSVWSSNPTWCNGTCMVAPDSSQEMGNCWLDEEPTGGYYRQHCEYPTALTGAQCSVPSGPNDGHNPPGDPPPEKNRCPLGTKQTGTTSSGTPICTPDKPDAPPTKDTTTTKTTNPDGSTTERTTETTRNSDGSTTTRIIERTTWPDGRSTSTDNKTVSDKPGGGAGTDDSSDRSDLCKQHPTLNICRNSQISGRCESVSCDGDAITCAIAREVSIKNCKEQEAIDAIKASSQYALGNAVMSGADPMGASLPSKQNAEQINIGALSADGFGGGGACFSDKTFTILGRSVVVPFSAACPSLEAFRYVVMLIALLGAFKMLSGAVLRR